MEHLSPALAGLELGKDVSQKSLESLAVSGMEARVQEISVTVTL